MRLILALLVACVDPTPQADSDTDPSVTDTMTAPPQETGMPPSACTALGLPARPWDPGPYTSALHGVAGDFTLPTRSGDWTFSERFTGCEVYLVVPSVPTQEEGWPTPLWQRDAKDLIATLPANAHVFFVSSADDKSAKDADLDLIERKIESQLDDLSPEDAAWRRDRVHYVTRKLSDLDGWLGDYLRTPGFGVVIDRFQRIRDIGSLADGERYNSAFGWFEPNLSHVAHEAIYANHQAELQARLDATPATVIPAFTGQIIQDGGWAGVKGFVEVDLPDAATMATFDTLELDLSMTCDGPGELGYCPAWDRITSLYLCARATEASQPVEEACQPYVPGRPAIPELLGNCIADGFPTGDPCVTVEDCPSAGAVLCEGYVPAQAEVPAVPADTLPCACEEPDGRVVDAVRTCDADGVGFGACDCACDDEIGRWISTYHREGRWVSDASHALPWMAEGGRQRLGYYSIDPWEVTLDLRLSAAGGPRPVTTTALFTGGSFGPAYNDKYAPVEVAIPSAATRVELSVLITGHGMESPGNCAEFCDTDHHFGVNGVDHAISFPDIDDPEGCQNDVAHGTVPNQYGTWFYARSNWCPGKHVAPIVIDVTADVTPGETATFTYAGFRLGAPYSSDGASIALTSWVTVRE